MRRFIALMFVAFAFSACSSGEETIDCPSGTVLSGGACRPTCANDSECLASERCSNGACVSNGGGGGDAGPADTGGFRDAAEPLDLGVIECTHNEDCGGRV